MIGRVGVRYEVALDLVGGVLSHLSEMTAREREASAPAPERLRALVALRECEAPARAAAKTAAPDYYKALTVKLDRERYEALKTLGVKLDKKSQEIFVEALDLYLQQTAQSA